MLLIASSENETFINIEVLYLCNMEGFMDELREVNELGNVSKFNTYRGLDEVPYDLVGEEVKNYLDKDGNGKLRYIRCEIVPSNQSYKVSVIEAGDVTELPGTKGFNLKVNVNLESLELVLSRLIDENPRPDIIRVIESDRKIYAIFVRD